MVTGRRNDEHPDIRPGAWRRGWPVVLALFLLVTGSGLGGAGGLAQMLRGGPQAGAGAADSRDPALVRHGARLAVLAQRAIDPAAAPASAEPALAPQPLDAPRSFAPAGPSGSARTAALPAPPTRAYRARAPPLGA